MSSPDPTDPPTSEPPREPRDSRLEAFLRQAEGVLAAQRQWSAQTQVKLKTLAKELGLPPELFQTALEHLADPARHTPPTRWEQAFCEYLEKQLQQLPGDILPLPKERKALSYGRQKFQLSPDACERCLTRVAKQLGIARISDAQAVAFAQQEIARLVSHQALPADQLREQVLQLAQRAGVEEKSADRLLTQELARRRAKRRRIWLRQVGLTLGTAMLSVSLIVAIVALGRLLTPPNPEPRPVIEANANPLDQGQKTPPPAVAAWVGPAWWGEKQQNFADHWIERGQPAELLTRLTDPNGNRRAAAYRELLGTLADLDRQLYLNPTVPTRWWRQPNVQEMLLECFWHEPDLAAARALIEGLRGQRSNASESLLLPTTSSRMTTTANESAADRAAGLAAATVLLADFLTARAAETILLRAYQQGLGTPSPVTGLPGFEDKLGLLTSGQPALRNLRNTEQLPVAVAQLRSKWVAEGAESLYLRLQSLWPAVGLESTAAESPAWREAVTAVADAFRQLPQAAQRFPALLTYWSGVVGLDPNMAAWAWADLTEPLEQMPAWAYRPLIDSWYVSAIESPWSRQLDSHWQRWASENQLELTGDRAADAVRLQVLFGTPPLPSHFQLQLRRTLVLQQIAAWRGEPPSDGRDASLADWQRLMRLVTLAQAALTCEATTDPDRMSLNLAAFDRLVATRSPAMAPNSLPSTSNDPTSGVNFPALPQLEELWQRLRQTSDVETYRDLATQWVQQLPPDTRLPWSHAAQLVDYLLQSRSATEQAAWILAWRGNIDNQGSASRGSSGQMVRGRPPIEAMLEFPTIALALSDALVANPAEAPAQLAWLGCPTTVDPATLVQEWRRVALRTLQQADRQQGLTLAAKLGQSYQREFSLRATWSPTTFTTTSTVAGSGHDPVLAALLLQDAWRAAATVAGDPTSATALQDDRVLVENQTSPLLALWTAENLALQRLEAALRAFDSSAEQP
jgi:hypothetical protein